MYRASKAINLTLATLLIAVCTLPSVAQTTTRGPNETQIPTDEVQKSLPGASRPGSAPTEILLRSAQVQKELGLTSEQIKQLEAVDQQARSALTRSRGTAQPSSDEVEAEVTKTRDAVAKVLKPEQLVRFREILAQVTGYQAEPVPITRSRGTPFKDPIGLTSEQHQKLDGINTQHQQNVRGTFVRSRSSNPQEACQTIMSNRGKIQPILEASRAQAEQALTAEQRQAIEKLRGEPISLETPPCAPPTTNQ